MTREDYIHEHGSSQENQEGMDLEPLIEIPEDGEQENLDPIEEEYEDNESESESDNKEEVEVVEIPGVENPEVEVIDMTRDTNCQDNQQKRRSLPPCKEDESGVKSMQVLNHHTAYTIIRT